MLVLSGLSRLIRSLEAEFYDSRKLHIFPIQSLSISPLIGIAMTYPFFHQLHPELEGQDIKPVFYDTDGSPVYDCP